jgi:hypothetical protein
MVHCSCGKPIEKIPDWLSTAKVDFVCNNCPNRSHKNIAFVTLEPDVKPAASDDLEVETDEVVGDDDL